MKIIVSEDQNTVIADGVKTTFKEMKRSRGGCKKCWWHRFEVVCAHAPCIDVTRKDGKDGIFTIQNMPNGQKETTTELR